jgi:hypothetical protein
MTLSPRWVTGTYNCITSLFGLLPETEPEPEISGLLAQSPCFSKRPHVKTREEQDQVHAGRNISATQGF